MNLKGILPDPKQRAIAWQAALVAALAALIIVAISNAAANLEKQNIASGFGFLRRTAGFDISQTLIHYTNLDTYARAFWVGLTNTLLVAALGIVFATLLGFLIGISRLSPNWLIAKLALVYIELVRNVPLLLWLFVIYFGVLLQLPSPAESVHLPFGTLLNRRGLYLPLTPAPLEWLTALVLAIAGLMIAPRAKARFEAGLAPEHNTHRFWWVALSLLPAIAVVLLAGSPHKATLANGQFNIEGGLGIEPELIALLAGLVTYTAAYIAEIVRAGILSVSRGQGQAAAALGLTPGQVLRHVVMPQALRAIIPPLTNQYVNLAKNSSLAVAVGYPDLVSVFAGTILNHTNQAVETIAITMAVYLALSLSLSAAMNALNARVALKER